MLIFSKLSKVSVGNVYKKTHLFRFICRGGILPMQLLLCAVLLSICALKISITESLLSNSLSSLQGEQGLVGSPGAKGYPGRQVQ